MCLRIENGTGCINVSQHLITWAKQCSVHMIIPLSSEGSELGFKSAMLGDLQFIGLSSLNVSILYKTPQTSKRLSLDFERGIISVCETVVGSYTLEAVVRCNNAVSSLSWQSALLQDLGGTRPLPR